MNKWTTYIRRAIRRSPPIHAFSRLALRISLQLTVCLYALGWIAGEIAPFAADYFTAMAYRQAAFDNAPATLLAGLIGACAADILLRRYPPDSDT